MSIKVIINTISIWSIVLPLILGSFLISRLSRDSLIVWGIVTLGAIPELLRVFISDCQFLHIAYNLYTPFEFIMLSLLYQNKFLDTLYINIFRISIRVYIIASMVLIGTFGIAHRFVNEWVCINNLIFTAWTLMFITEQFRKDSDMYINTRSPFFWYITAYFFYSPCTLLIYSLWHYIKKNHDSLLNNLWIIHNVFNIAMYVFFTIGFLKDRRRHISGRP